jgi:general secretion pathway protein D
MLPSARPDSRAEFKAELDMEELIPDFKISADNVDQVIPTLEWLTGKKVLRSVTLGGTNVNFRADGPIERYKAIMVVESLLALNNVAVVTMGDFLKVVPNNDLQRQAPNIIRGSTLDYYPSLTYYQKRFTFNYLRGLQEAQGIVQPLMTNQTQIIPFPKENALLLTDTLINLQRIERLLEDADRPQTNQMTTTFVDLKNVNARDVVQQVQALTTGQSPLADQFSNNTVIQADERTNKVIIVTHPSNLPVLKSLIQTLDEDVEPNTSHRVFRIKHAEATSVQSVLDSLISGQQQATEQARGRQVNNRPASNNSEGAAPTTPVNSSTANLSFSEYVNVVADERSNAIFATGTRNDMALLEQLIEDIDVLLPQVRIEVVIAEVSLTEGQVSGLESFGISTGADGSIGIDASMRSSETVGTPLQIGAGGEPSGEGFPTIPLSGDFYDNLDMSVVFSTARNKSNVDILSAPVLVTTHNKEASINVSEQRPVVSGTTIGETTTSNVDFRDIGIQLTVTPLIGDNGQIQLEIEQTVDNFVENILINNNPQPVISKREANSFVSVADGNVIILGGLKERTLRNSEGRVFLLGDIPILGALFRPDDQAQEITELIFFIRPTVINSNNKAQALSDEYLRSLPNGQDIEHFFEEGDFPDMELPPYDPLNVKKAMGMSDEFREAGDELDEANPRPRGPRRR